MNKIEFTPEEVELLKAQFGRALFQSVDTTQKLKGLSNEEIGKLLFRHVWAYVDALTPQSDLILEAIERLGYITPDDMPEDEVAS